MKNLSIIILVLGLINQSCSPQENIPDEIIIFLDAISSPSEIDIKISHEVLFKDKNDKLIIGKFERDTPHGIPYMYFLDTDSIQIIVNYSSEDIKSKTMALLYKNSENLTPNEKVQLVKEVITFVNLRRQFVEKLTSGGSVVYLKNYKKNGTKK